ncbi:FG-GAP repeat domain-containing protein [Streptomyces cinereoruber]|uniref:FG-GAP repeat domain-containing protein n=1 Tax=Streptomyces cinereoruber TaxID=67260 RepID=UPI003628FC26
MAKTSGLNRTGILSRVTVAAITAALVGTTTAAVAADAPAGRSASGVQQDVRAGAFATSAVATPENALYGVDGSGTIWGYQPTGGGAIKRLSENSGTGWGNSKHINQADATGDGRSDGLYDVYNGRLYYTKWRTDPRDLGGGWNAYNEIVAVANTGGAPAEDLIARDTAGVLWHYLGTGNGGLTARYRIGGGWNAYTQIAGKGDLTRDGKPDIVARDKSGGLWLYKGTGNYKAPFGPRTYIGGGWNTFNALVSTGDLNFDGVADLVARDKVGALWLYKGTGKASAPFSGRVQIGTNGWNGFRELF